MADRLTRQLSARLTGREDRWTGGQGRAVTHSPMLYIEKSEITVTTVFLKIFFRGQHCVSIVLTITQQKLLKTFKSKFESTLENAC